MLSTLLSTLPFVALVAADLTTSIWAPTASYPYLNITVSTRSRGYYASVVNVNNDRTVLAVRNIEAANPSQTIPDPNYVYTMTVGPSYFNVISPFTFVGMNFTQSAECTSSSQGAVIVCTEILNGPGVFSSICSGGPDTDDAPLMTRSSIGYISGYPPFCFTDTTVPTEYLAYTVAAGENNLSIASYKVIITAGEEKLSATTGATPTNTAPPVTGAATTGTGTGGAGPMKTSAPLLAGLGAAMAIFVM
jgi:hypothetical protein